MSEIAETPRRIRVRMSAEREAARARAIVMYQDALAAIKDQVPNYFAASTTGFRPSVPSAKLYDVKTPRDLDCPDPPASSDQRSAATTFEYLAILLRESADTTAAFEAASAAMALADQKP